jgi:hypothetical protein
MIRTTKDGRTIRTGHNYTAFRRNIHEEQSGACMKCERPTSLTAPLEWDSSFHLHHIGGQGNGRK